MKGHRFSVVNQPKERPQPINLLRDAAETEQLVMHAIRAKSADAVLLPSLVRSFCLLVYLIQELRGIPKPGQLRPDLDPVQLARALKRHKSRAVRQVLDVAKSAQVFDDTGEAIEVQKGEPKKESLKTGEGVTTGPDGKGDKGGRSL